jgi:ABC-2 type transport system ATP-binding protein
MNEPDEAVVAVADLTLVYRQGFWRRQRVMALDGVDLRAGRGDLVGVVGPNGSGKSSFLRCLLGHERPARGSVRVLGAPAGPRRDEARGIGHVAEGRLPFAHLTARELLTLSGLLANETNRAAQARADAWLERVGLADQARRRHGTFSAGMERRLALAMAMLHEPALLLLDEPTAGLDPFGVEMLRDELRRHAERGGCALVATHELEDFGGLFTHLLVLWDGRRLAFGPAAEVLGDPERHEIRVRGLPPGALAGLVRAAEGAGGKVEHAGPAQRTLGEWLLRARAGAS